VLTSDFLTFLGFWFQFPGGQKPVCNTSADTHESSPLYLLKNKMSSKKFKWPDNPRYRHKCCER